MNYIYIPSLDSTQTYLKKHLDTLPSPIWVCAGHQTQGVGQFDRKWESQPNQNVLCSLLIKHADIKFLQDIQFKVSSKIIHLLSLYDIKAYFKAPNDIFASDKKLCGILVDTKIHSNQSHIIIGIGLNVNQTIFHDTLVATSMKLETQKDFNVEDIILHIQEITQELI